MFETMDRSALETLALGPELAGLLAQDPGVGSVERAAEPAYVPAMRRAAASAVTVMLTLGAVPLPPIAAAAAAPGGQVTTIIATQPVAQGAAGATLSLIQVCPTNAVLARSATRAAVSPTPAGFRLLSRELWPAGMVTRWRVSAGFASRTPRATAVCRESVELGATRYVGSARVVVRLWGPAPRKVLVETSTDVSVMFAGRRLDRNLAVQWLTSTRLFDKPFAEVDGDGLLTAAGGIAGPYQAGTYGGFKVAMRISAQLQ